jgi:selenocysteine-specific elongation factor
MNGFKVHSAFTDPLKGIVAGDRPCKEHMEIIVGTAGHIDHGKTALVSALTGINADRLPEEKRRGITIDIGFAALEVEGVHFGFVDVPGHERFVKNMLAGASGIDLVLLVIAANEGVMPQTREHFDICRLLGVKHGLVVLTKCDLVDGETLELARLEAGELVDGSFLDGASIVAVSSVSGEGIDQLRQELVRAARKVCARGEGKTIFMPIDRSFAVKGFGAVVTGTLASGQIDEAAELELLPQIGKVRVRGIQSHDRQVKQVRAGQRTALNLGGIEHTEVVRGMVLSEIGVLRPTQVIDAEVELLNGTLRPLRSRQRVRMHIGTAEVLSRLTVLNDEGSLDAGKTGFVQFRLESPVTCRMNDRFIIRLYSPQQTIGGGRVLMPLAEKFRRKEAESRIGLLSALTNTSDPAEIVRIMTIAAGRKGITRSEIRAATGWLPELLEDGAKMNLADGHLVDLGERLIDKEAIDALCSQCVSEIGDFQLDEPLAAGMSRELLRERVFRRLSEDVFAACLLRLGKEHGVVTEKEILKLGGHQTKMPPEEKAALEKIKTAYTTAGLLPPKLDETIGGTSGSVSPKTARKLLDLLVRNGELVKVSEEFYFSSEAIEVLRSSLLKAANRLPDRIIDVSSFKELAGVSRKYAIPLLEYFDRERVTARAGDKRVVLK